ncbi:MAG: oligosaccharide flippase family protein [Desulfomonilia bacterium]
MAIKELRFLLRHSSVYGLGTIFAQAAGFLLLPFYTNYLTPADYGVAAIVETSIAIIGVMLSMGLHQAIARFYAEGSESEARDLVISTSYIFTALISLPFVPMLLLVSAPLSELLFKRSDYGTFFMLSSLGLFMGFFVQVGLTYLVLKARSSTYVLVTISNTVMLILLNVYFIAFKGTGLIGIFYSALIAKTTYAVLLSAPILMKTGLGFSFGLGLRMIWFAIPLGFSTIFRIITNESDKLFINYFFSPFETGIYAVAVKIATGVHLLLTMTFVQSFQPIRYQIAKEEGGPRTYGSIFEQYLLAIGAFGLFLSIFSDEIIRLMTAEEFYTSAMFIPPLILSWIMFGSKYHLENGILLSMKSRYIFYISGVSSAVNIILNILLIPRWGLWGAVLSSNVSNAILAGASFVVSQRFYRIDIRWFKVMKLAACISVCFALSILASRLDTLMSFAAKLAIMAGFCGSVFALGLIEMEVFLPLTRKLFPAGQHSRAHAGPLGRDGIGPAQEPGPGGVKAAGRRGRRKAARIAQASGEGR